MTRETKIGLLVGLAFIVVFAMLLSHSGPTPIDSNPAPRQASSRSVVSQVPPDITLSPWSSNSTGPPLGNSARRRCACCKLSASGALR